MMTGGQSTLGLGYEAGNESSAVVAPAIKLHADRPPLRVIHAEAAELEAHQQRLQQIQKASGEKCLWLKTLH